MHKEETLAKIREVALLAVLRGPSSEITLKMVDALVAGGVTGIEVTYSTPNAPEVVRKLRGKYGEEILLGMGTLTEVHQPEEARQAGASFIVSPHCELKLGQAMVSTGLVVMIGAMTPSEVRQAYKLGADIVKIFPGSLLGPGYIKSLHGPFPEIPMMPSGGVSQSNIADWFAAGAVAVGVGSELTPIAWANEGRFEEITRNAREFRQAVDRALAGRPRP